MFNNKTSFNNESFFRESLAKWILKQLVEKKRENLREHSYQFKKVCSKSSRSSSQNGIR